MTVTKQHQQLLVSAIRGGTVIDHIHSGQVLKILSLLNLGGYKKIVTVGLSLPSKQMEMKDLIKIEGKELGPQEIHRIAVLAPNATVNIIRNYRVVRKTKVQLPEMITRVMVCPNPKCITNHEDAETKFMVLARNGSVRLKCSYCEKVYHGDEIRDYRID